MAITSLLAGKVMKEAREQSLVALISKGFLPPSIGRGWVMEEGEQEVYCHMITNWGLALVFLDLTFVISKIRKLSGIGVKKT
ncbi:hypothetical protein Tco_0836519 [Tanacetum coccineum]